MDGRFVVVIAIFALVHADGVEKRELLEKDLKFYRIFVPEDLKKNFIDQVGDLYKTLYKDHELYINRILDTQVLTLLQVPTIKAQKGKFAKFFEDNGSINRLKEVPKDVYVHNGHDAQHNFYSFNALNYTAINFEEKLDDTTDEPITTTEAAALNEDQPTTANPAPRKFGCWGEKLLGGQFREKFRKTGCCR